MKDRGTGPSAIPDSQDNLKQYFTDLVRDNLTLVLCMSPLNPMFPVRARKFPGLISGPTIDWFLSWPADALVAVSRGFIKNFKVECDEKSKLCLMDHMGAVHSIVNEVCEEYFIQYRRAVHSIVNEVCEEYFIQYR